MAIRLRIPRRCAAHAARPGLTRPRLPPTLGQLTLEVRTAAGRVEALPQLAQELVRAQVDVILAIAPLSVRAARQASSTVPIDMALGDPASFENLARPGGNVTGVTALAAELAGKQVELIKEALPRATRIAVLRNPDQPVHAAKLEHAGRWPGRAACG